MMKMPIVNERPILGLDFNLAAPLFGVTVQERTFLSLYYLLKYLVLMWYHNIIAYRYNSLVGVSRAKWGVKKIYQPTLFKPSKYIGSLHPNPIKTESSKRKSIIINCIGNGSPVTFNQKHYHFLVYLKTLQDLLVTS